ncbi:hypothetical protein F5B20DRAFT_562791 [Whalleya microplaca]|nr:hypothetical protein F5B20DRAFT_562791 [Whalleya microplaca]
MNAYNFSTQGHTNIFPIAYQSQNIPFTEWVSLLTLGLAPLVAHIAAGVPQPSYLYERLPKWHERLCLYNPTSILWRYAAITDRRIRAKAWDKKDMAATNALFWTSRGWDGSEDMVTSASPYCTLFPEHSRINLFSREMLKTIIVTLQGTQAVVALGMALGGSSSSDGFVVFMGVDLIFFPLAFIGLVRLFCALWLTDDFAYTSLQSTRLIESTAAKNEDARISLDSLLDVDSGEPNSREDRFLPTSFWGSRVFRVAFLLPTLGLWVICVLFLLQPQGGKSFTITAFLVAIFYLIFLSISLVICGYYLARGRTTTAIPCIGSAWYQAYTVFLMGAGLALIVVACIETRRTACGRWTSAPIELGDWLACSNSRTPDVVDMGHYQNHGFGLASGMPSRDQHNNTLGQGEFWVHNFTGTCLGMLHSTLIKHSSTLEEVDLKTIQGIIQNNPSSL